MPDNTTIVHKTFVDVTVKAEFNIKVKKLDCCCHGDRYDSVSNCSMVNSRQSIKTGKAWS